MCLQSRAIPNKYSSICSCSPQETVGCTSGMYLRRGRWAAASFFTLSQAALA